MVINKYSLLPFLLITVPLVCVLAGIGVIGWGVVPAVVIAVGVLALVTKGVARSTTS
ncbi:hypothetical protein [Streptomyces sp. WM6378]|uniref:hypothetical protein n=1 Tax=Streptomyces sp. WM6378 TaxID=1415557 RepID=UPI00131CF1D1|nr:hypothetical protein [Streptomyces sp. WM6378]